MQYQCTLTYHLFCDTPTTLLHLNSTYIVATVSTQGVDTVATITTWTIDLKEWDGVDAFFTLLVQWGGGCKQAVFPLLTKPPTSMYVYGFLNQTVQL